MDFSIVSEPGGWSVFDLSEGLLDPLAIVNRDCLLHLNGLLFLHGYNLFVGCGNLYLPVEKKRMNGRSFFKPDDWDLNHLLHLTAEDLTG